MRRRRRQGATVQAKGTETAKSPCLESVPCLDVRVGLVKQLVPVRGRELVTVRDETPAKRVTCHPPARHLTRDPDQSNPNRCDRKPGRQQVQLKRSCRTR
jgi:hypothetical protein